MSAPFITYFEAIAKLNQVANKQTIFLSHILYHMEFDKVRKQYIVDMSTARKISIMNEVSPEASEKGLLNLANQYLNKLKKAELIKSAGRGIWLVNPMCYGKFRTVSKQLRTENAKIYSSMTFGKEGLEFVSTGGYSPETGDIVINAK